MQRPKEIHFLDTSIFIGAISEDPYQEKCETYFNKVRTGIYEAYTTPIVLGEALMIIKREILPHNRSEAIYSLLQVADLCKIHIADLQKFYKSLKELKDLRNTIGDTDVKILAEAINSPAKIFVTIGERKMNVNAVKKYLEIKHVKNL